MAEELKEGAWHTDLEEFMAKLFEAKRELHKGYWCMDPDVKYLTIRIDTRDLGYLVFADGRGNASNAKNKFRISPKSVLAAIKKWRDKYHSPKKGDVSEKSVSTVESRIVEMKTAKASLDSAVDILRDSYEEVAKEVMRRNSEIAMVCDAMGTTFVKMSDGSIHEFEKFEPLKEAEEIWIEFWDMEAGIYLKREDL